LDSSHLAINLSGSADIKIDTGPAMTALAGGSNSFAPAAATETPSDNNAALIAEPPRASMRSAVTATAEPSVTSTLQASVTPTKTTEVTQEPTESIATTQEPTEDSEISAVPESTSTRVPAATETQISTATAVVTSTATKTATSTPIPKPKETPTVVLSQIERAKNGDFELGNDGSWYLEQGAVIDARGGVDSDGVLSISNAGGYADQRLFFVPETNYRMTASVKLDSKASKQETAQVGISYTDEAGTRLTQSEPAPLTVTGTGWTEITFDYTPPAGAQNVMVFLWKSSGKTSLLVDNVSVRSIVPAEALATGVIASDPNSMTILLMGVDARPGEAIDIGVRPDSLMVLHLNADTGSCRVLSIPRDTRTELPGYGLTKINHALAVGGIDYEVQVVEKMLGLEIDHYLLIDFNGFEDLVDAMGGISVDVPEAFVSDDGREFPAGVQSMTGVQALSYARWRGGSDGDFGRMQRQQLILRALVQKASGLNVVRSINELLPAVEENLRTDLSPSEMASIATDYRTGCTESNISMIRLEGNTATYDDPLLQLPLSYVEVEAGEIRQKVATLIEP